MDEKVTGKNPSTVKTIAIVEDNINDAAILTGMLEKHFPSLEILGVLSTFDQAVKELPGWRPDLLLLDINLPGGYAGFDVIGASARNVYNAVTCQEERRHG